ncbi:hypothetical protein BS47DRAFT_1396408 [Hydnum rufescens UP504]|uniref:G protein-coupled receptor GPR1/2/3 C-terminal domain-containing protein n=1 Tax=Hydnum rufescens UP504 TaxID=1448309 RepID=A0A9P6AQE4_9AGAM|nr:hypothetical protein BS47DRAFT_1396408 [Hydnum rufescens UP504]
MANTTDNWNTSLQNNFALRSGLLLLAEVAVVSFIGPTILLAITIRQAIKNYRLHGDWVSEDYSLQPVSLLFLVAIFMDMQVIQAMGNILTARWAFNGKVTEGSYCTTQAVLQQIGDDGLGLRLRLRHDISANHVPRQAQSVTSASACSGYDYLDFPLSVSYDHYSRNDYPTLLWEHWSSRLKIGSEYVYFWLAAAVTLVLYGIIVVNWLREATANRDRRLLRDAISMGWYPIAYIIEIFPVSLVRFRQWSAKGHGPRHGVIVAAAILFAASGTINVLLWLITGRRFGFSDPPEDEKEEDRKREFYQMGMLAPVAQETQAPTETLATAGRGSRVSHLSFPHDVLMARAGAYVPEPYEWAPPREGELGP